MQIEFYIIDADRSKSLLPTTILTYRNEW